MMTRLQVNMSNRMKISGFTALLLTLLMLGGCRPAAQSATTADYDARLAVTWFDLQLKLVKETAGFTPPVAARALGYSGVTLYEAVVPGMPDHQSLVGQLSDLPSLPQPLSGEEYHWPSVANSALASITRKLYPTATRQNLTAVTSLEQRWADQFVADVDTAVLERSVNHGRLLAEAIYVWSLNDGSHHGYITNFPAGYVSPAGVGMWVSTPPGYNPALQPFWGATRPFTPQPITQCDPGPPPEYSEDPGSEFYAEALEVYTTAAYLTEEQKEIALFWADDPGQTATPPGHWISILNQILVEKGDSLDTAAEAYAKVGIATADAFISCWHTKYKYGLLRPITYIQQVIDPNWNKDQITDAVITPPFPEYTSGHSVQSGAAAWVLTGIFGDDFAFTDDTHYGRGFASRSFNSFKEAAHEAAISRLYGGIHYPVAIERGLLQGECIGQRVDALQFRK